MLRLHDGSRHRCHAPHPRALHAMEPQRLADSGEGLDIDFHRQVRGDDAQRPA